MDGELPSAWLTLPAAGERALPQVLRKLQLLALRGLLSQPSQALPLALRNPVTRAQHSLFQATKQHSTRVLAALASPDVLGPLLGMQNGTVTPEVALPAAVPNLLAALALQPGPSPFEETCLWDVPVARLCDRPGRRVLSFTPSAQGLHVDSTGLELRLDSNRLLRLSSASVPAGDSECRETRPLHPLAEDLPGPELAELDTNPLCALEAHPDKGGNALDLGGRAPADWLRALGSALELIRCALPALYAELPWSLSRVVPVGYERERHLSASYREVPGLIYLTLHPSELTLAEAIVHETQHGKLNALSWLDPVLANGHTQWTKSPVRPDLRPLMGVLLALHAFVPVAALHQRLTALAHPIAQTEHFAERRREVLASNAESLEIISTLGEPTPLGGRLLKELGALHQACVARA